MLRLILILIASSATILTLTAIIRFGLKAVYAWDRKICNRLNTSFTGYTWYFRIPLSIGVLLEFFYFMVLGGNNYFSSRWWALRTSSYLSLLLFIAILFSSSDVVNYYSFSFYAENGISALFSSGTGFWYLNMVNLLFLGLIAVISFESIKMHKWWAPIRILFYSVISILMAVVTLAVLGLIIILSLFYIAYKIIKWFMTARKRHRAHDDDDDDKSPVENLNNSYRRFRAELYAWEKERSESIPAEKEKKKPVIKRKRPKIERKPKPVPNDNDIPRFYPDK